MEYGHLGKVNSTLGNEAFLNQLGQKIKGQQQQLAKEAYK